MFVVLLFSDFVLLNFGEDALFKEVFLSLNVYRILDLLGAFGSLAIVAFLHMTEWTHFPI